MKRVASVLCCLALLCVPASAARAADDKAPPKVDVTGTWKAEVEVAGQTGEPVFTLKQEGDKLTGKYSGTLGEQDLTGKVDGNKVEFKFTTDQGDVVYTGTVDKDAMKGTAKYGDAFTGTWTAKREAPAADGKVDKDKIVGRWKIVGADEPLLKDATLDFTRDGALTLTLSVITLEGKYEVSGGNLKITMKVPGQQERTDTHRIEKLSDTELVIKDGNSGKVTNYTRSTAQALDFTRTQDVIYGRKHGVALTMDVFAPKEKGNGRGIIWCVSGGWYSAKQAVSVGFAKPFLERGYTVFQVVHGSQPKFTIPEVLEDMHRAVRFIKANAAQYGVDPDKLGIAGGSAGGHLSLMQGCAPKDGDPNAADPVERQSSKVAAVACFYPPTDFLNYGKEGEVALGNGVLKDFKAPFDFHELDPQTKSFVPVTDESKRRELGRKISPVNFVTKDDAPTLIIHGDADQLVPIQQAELVIAKLKENNVPSQLVVKKGAGHGWIGLDKDLVTLAEWFDTHLLGNRGSRND